MPLGPAELLRQKGFKVTAQRLAVLRAVAGRPHLTAEEVVEIVTDDIGAISHRAVYDAVGVLADIGLLRRIQPSGSPARYEDRVGDNHHHLICRVCGCMVDVDCAVGATPCLTAADDAGYDIDEAEVIYWGRCPTCRQDAEGARVLSMHESKSVTPSTQNRPSPIVNEENK
jgi:Fur family transcriptional regulator, stress-responsive regulator